MSDPQTFVIVGAGLAGAKAAETLREEGFDGRVVLVGDEAELPYERPPLSKGYLAGTAAREDAHVHPAGFYDEQRIELIRGVAAASIDVAGHRVALADGRELGYDRLLLATGSIPGRPPIDGIGLAGVHVLRRLAHADALRASFAPGRSVAIIGAGWIGCEVAAAARAHDARVTLIEAGGAPLERVLGPRLGAFFARVHREHGVDVVTDAKVERIEGRAGVERLRLAGGRVVECDVVVVGIGIAPDTRLAAAAGLAVDNGVVADEQLRTSAADVYVAGDVASAFHPRYGRHVRVEHWANALNQGIAAARSMLDRGEPYARLPYFFSDQYETGLEYAGLHDPSDRLVVRGDLAASHLQAFWIGAGGRVTAGMHIDEWDAIEPIKQLVERDEVVDPARLADRDVPLDAVAAAGSSA